MNFEAVRLWYANDAHKPYPTHVSDEAWAFAAPWLDALEVHNTLQSQF
jgi:hypothetical protein